MRKRIKGICVCCTREVEQIKSEPAYIFYSKKVKEINNKRTAKEIVVYNHQSI